MSGRWRLAPGSCLPPCCDLVTFSCLRLQALDRFCGPHATGFPVWAGQVAGLSPEFAIHKEKLGGALPARIEAMVPESVRNVR